MATKYANLPDIDTAPDVYETVDVVEPTAHGDDSSGDEASKSAQKRGIETASKEELDDGNLMSAKDARIKFRKAEKRRARTVYAYPNSGDENSEDERSKAPFNQRLKLLQAELAALEAEIADPSIAASKKSPGEDSTTTSIKELADVRHRLEKVGKARSGSGRTRLVETVVGSGVPRTDGPSTSASGTPTRSEFKKDRGIAELDRRLSELERMIGSSSAALDESSPLPPPLLPMFTRLNTQLTILTQPRTIDAISRRLKLLLTDLDKLSTHPSASVKAVVNGTSESSSNVPAGLAAPSQLQQEITPILQRLAPHLPTLPHILARLKTLSSLHASAAEFQNTLDQLEQEQSRNRAGVEELERAVKSLEQSLTENANVAKRNVESIEGRISDLAKRLDTLRTE